MDIDVFYTLPNNHPLKLLHVAIFAPLFIASLLFVFRTWRSRSWRPLAALFLLFVAHTAYVIAAPRLYFGDRWYAPQTPAVDPRRFTDDPTTESSR